MKSPEPNKWFHIIFSYNGTSVSAYVDGTPVDPLSNVDREKVVNLPDQPVMFVGKLHSEGTVNANFTLDDLHVFPYVVDQNNLGLFQ